MDTELEDAIKRVEIELDKPAWTLVKEHARIGAAIKALPEGTGVVKNSYGFSDIKRNGKPENDEWHTRGKVFLNPLEAAQTILDNES